MLLKNSIRKIFILKKINLNNRIFPNFFFCENILNKNNTISKFNKYNYTTGNNEKNKKYPSAYSKNENNNKSLKKYNSSNKNLDTNNNYNNSNSLNHFKNTLKNPMDFSYKIEKFHNSASKYSLKTDEDEINKFNEGTPKFFKEEGKSNKIKVEIGGYKFTKDKKSQSQRTRILKSGKKMTLQKKIQQRPLSFKDKQELKKQRLEEERKKERLMTKEEKKLIQNKETSVDRFDANYWMVEKKRLSEEMQEIRKERIMEHRRIFNVEDLTKFQDTERLSKRLARLGVSSRRQAEKLINNGLIKVDGEIIKSNIPVNENNQIQVFSNQEYRTPMSNNTKVWLFYKPNGYVCDAKDERKRPNIFQFLAKRGFPINHFITVGKLDYSSEGLMVLTNDGDLASALESNTYIERAYKIRFFGRMFTQEKLERIRRGVMVNNKLVKFWAETIRQRHTNSWIHLKSSNNSISDIRNIFERLSLRINRIIRTDYGPFRLAKLKSPGDVLETNIPKILNTYLYFKYQEKMQNSLRKLDDTKLEVIKEKMIKDQRRKLIAAPKDVKKNLGKSLNNKDNFKKIK